VSTERALSTLAWMAPRRFTSLICLLPEEMCHCTRTSFNKLRARRGVIDWNGRSGSVSR
jgi:hypothetical protein